MKLFIVLSSLLIIVSCENTNTNQNISLVFPETNISFEHHILPLIKINCGLSFCHGQISPQAGVLTYDYFTLMTSYNGALIIPLNPEGSVLVQIIEYKLPHNPNLSWSINENQRKGIRRWILEGAKNN